MSIARDGTGGLVYLKSVGGAAHVFVSQLVAGSFRSPVQVDPGLAGASSHPVIAAGTNGLLVVGFINSGQLYVVEGNSLGQFVSPLRLIDGASNPAISMTYLGKAYLAFAVADGGGYDVRTAYYYGGRWELETPPLNQTPADDAGSGTDRGPSVAAAGDGIAIVAWGEQGHIYSRRVWGTTASEVVEQADAPPAGCTENSSDEPAIGSGGNSSYAPVAFHEQVTCGGQARSRVFMNRLRGSVYEGITAADGLGGSSTDGADDPRIAEAEYGQGWATSEGTDSYNVFAGGLGTNGAFTGTVAPVNSLADEAPPDPLPAIAGLRASFIAWQQQPGAAPGGEIRLRFAADGSTLGPEQVISSPAQGPIDAADGFAADGDVSGDAAVAWLQGGAGETRVVVDQLFQPPGGFSPVNGFTYATSSQPTLAWTRPAGWGPMSYALSLDGSQVAQTNSTAVQAPAPLADGAHSWSVTATNPAGQQSTSTPAILFVDTVAPLASIRSPARAVVGSRVRAVVSYVDLPPLGEPAADASGVATVVVRWGDGSVTHLALGRHVMRHLYKKAGTYRITLRVTDRAGHVTRVVKVVKVVKPKHKRKHKRPTTGRRG